MRKASVANMRRPRSFRDGRRIVSEFLMLDLMSGCEYSSKFTSAAKAAVR
jgi:hypothetical protein